MNSNTRDRLNKYKMLNDEIIRLSSQMDKRQQEVNDLTDSGIVVRMGDLLNEISRLTGFDRNEMKVNVDTLIAYYGKYDRFHLACLRADGRSDLAIRDECNLSITISSGEKNSFCCFLYPNIYVPFDFNDIQADGKMMYEHMNVCHRVETNTNREYTTYVVDKDIDNLILNIPFEYLTYPDNMDWYPAYIFTQAVMHCGDRSYNSRNQYVRSRARKND